MRSVFKIFWAVVRLSVALIVSISKESLSVRYLTFTCNILEYKAVPKEEKPLWIMWTKSVRWVTESVSLSLINLGYGYGLYRGHVIELMSCMIYL